MEIDASRLELEFVSPSGVFEPFLYFETNPKFAFPVVARTSGLSNGTRCRDMIQPPPVTKPAFGSNTTTYWRSTRELLSLRRHL
jgi:hypothetical protein